METPKRLIIDTEYKEASVVIGATLSISIPDAKLLLSLTDPNPDVNEEQDYGRNVEAVKAENMEYLRRLFRNVAEQILYTNTPATEREDFFQDIVKGVPYKDGGY